ncbi:Zn-dependent hydrolase [Sporomusa malonica]|uniref:N-carbamoyl-L-amino-acid hydrolase n=1 Tax=Sporomusa malonica TaxID=112901 RepID=A0A1W2DAP7_9FIRM|nr:Zn-dependent hydrolase [Sporomusa malonica]SMC94324.1 N-carbamoyl-L-amino-acid hydrolase [Sporomusa malonica]
MAIQANHSHTIEWVLAQLEHIAQFGQDKSGVTRLAFSKADHQARQYIIELMQDIGLVVHVDAIGNIIGRYEPEGIQAHVPAVVTGSHLDTVPAGGKYDGVLGVICGLAAVKRLKERSDIKHPLEVVVFSAEESSRFNFATMGSKAMAGLANISSWKRIVDQEGISFASELATLGLQIEHIGSAARANNSIKGFVELHIEQGRILEQGRVNIGIVDKVSSPTRLKITVTGMAGHSGGAPIEERQDALVSAAMIVLAVRNIAADYDYQGSVATVTILKTFPGAINVIPGQVEMWVDIRGTEHGSIIEILQEIKDAISTIADDNDTPVAIEVLASEKPMILDYTINKTIEDVCQKLKLTSLRLDSRSGHDAMNMAHIAPAGLIFIPCKEGVSHNGSEYVASEAIAAGLAVLTETIYQLAK